MKLSLIIILSFSLCSCISLRPNSKYLSQKSIPSKNLNDFCKRFENYPQFSSDISNEMPSLYGLLVDPNKKYANINGSFVEIKALNKKQFEITLCSSNEEILDHAIIKFNFKKGYLQGKKHFDFSSIVFFSGISTSLCSLGLNNKGNINVYAPRIRMFFFIIMPIPPFTAGPRRNERMNRYEFLCINKKESNENAARDATHP